MGDAQTGAIGEFMACWVQAPLQTVPYMCELLGCFLEVMGATDGNPGSRDGRGGMAREGPLVVL